MNIPISVIMPVYNAKKYVSQAIESILRQTYDKFEFIIVDNGSVDGTRDVIKYYAGIDKRIRPFFLSKKGFVNALNFGVSEAKYDWVARMDADDISLPERLELQLEFIKRNPHVAIVGSYGYYIDENNKRVLGEIKVGPVSVEEYRMLIEKNKFVFVLDVTKIINKKIFLEMKGYRELPVLQDLDFNCRVADRGGLILVLPVPLVKVRKIYTSETSSKFFLLQNTMRWIKYSMIQRRRGESEMPLEEFLKMLKNESFFKKLERYREDLGTYFFKKAGLALSYRKYISFLGHISLSFFISPDYVFKKIKQIYL